MLRIRDLFEGRRTGHSQFCPERELMKPLRRGLLELTTKPSTPDVLHRSGAPRGGAMGPLEIFSFLGAPTGIGDHIVKALRKWP